MVVEQLFTREPWPHQREGVEQTIRALSNGAASLCLTSPTGSGKTDMMIALTRWAREKSWQVLQVFQAAGEEIGVISSSMPHYEYEGVPIQIATMQTVLSRRRQEESYFVDADLVLVDEIHQQATGESAQRHWAFPTSATN
jgi:superfamily II DNA or RNA helicase